MPLEYDSPFPYGAIRQGEILSGMHLHTPQHSPTALVEGETVPVLSVSHNRMIVVNPDCDLEADFDARFLPPEVLRNPGGWPHIGDHHSLVPVVLLCDVFEESEIRGSDRPISSSDLWRRVRANQDERYHRFPASQIRGHAGYSLPELFLDFRRTYAVQTDWLYRAIADSAIQRVALVPPVYLHDLIQRYYSYYARVGLPD